MAMLYDYLEKHKVFIGYFGKDVEIKLELIDDDYILLTFNNKQYYIDTKLDENEEVRNILEKENIEVVFCRTCGKPFNMGYTVDSGWWLCCEDCFEETMNNDYGKEKWRGTNKEGESGGYYEYLDEDGNWEDTGIFYTEWF